MWFFVFKEKSASWGIGITAKRMYWVCLFLKTQVNADQEMNSIRNPRSFIRVEFPYLPWGQQDAQGPPWGPEMQKSP